MTEINPSIHSVQKKQSKGRPRQFDRNAALEQAMRLFWQKGFTATSLADLTTEMGITPPSFYAAFSSKEALYAEALAYYRETYAATLWVEFDNAKTVREAVETYLMNAVKLYSGHTDSPPLRGCMLALSAVGNEGNETLGKIVQDARLETLNKFEQRIEQGISDGEISKEKASGLARFTLAVLGGMSLQARDGASFDELTKVAEQALLIWDSAS